MSAEYAPGAGDGMDTDPSLSSLSQIPAGVQHQRSPWDDLQDCEAAVYVAGAPWCTVTPCTAPQNALCVACTGGVAVPLPACRLQH